MPTKNLVSPFARDGVTQRSYTFGGGAEIVFTADEDESGDPFPIGYKIDTGGGDDIIYGSSQDDELTGGDGDDTIYGGDGDDIINGGKADGSDANKGQSPPPVNFLVGDGVRQLDGTYSADLFGADGTASNDIINGGDGGSTNRIYGDYSFVSVAASKTFTGGNDTITGGDGDGDGADIADNDIFGDGETVSLGDGSTFNGGDDTITGGFDAANTIYGDSLSVSFSSNATFNGGDDVLTGGAGTSGFNIIYGDVSGVIFTSAEGAEGETFYGGADTITGGDGVSNMLFGDVVSISNDGIFVGGNDTITGGANGSNTMIGDANSFGNSLLGSVTGGDDTLISGTNANDTMTGDFGADPDFAGAVGGADTFVFGPNNGMDTITDFEPGKDEINLFDTRMSLVAINSNGDFVIDENDDHVSLDGDNLVIDLGEAADGNPNINTLTIVGITSLAVGDFDFDPLVIA